MQNGFLSADGFVWISFPDTLASRPRVPFPPEQGAKPVFTFQNVDDFKMGWLPTFPSHVSRLRPIHPNWIGVDGPAIMAPAIAPLSWVPTLLGFLSAPRLHRTFPPFTADPRSGNAIEVAQRMAWDPRHHPIILRPKFVSGSFALGVPTTISGGALTCTEITDTDLTTPTLSVEATTQPYLITDVLTTPTLVAEGLC